MALVLGRSRPSDSRTRIAPACALLVKAASSACRRIAFGTLVRVGARVRPEHRAAVPPQRGPRRARRAPDRSPFASRASSRRRSPPQRPLVSAVPWRRFASCIRTTSWSRCGFTGAPKIASGSSQRSTVSFFALTTSTSVAIGSSGPRPGPPRPRIRSSLPLLDRDHAARRPGNRPFDQHQVVLGIHRHHAQTAHRLALRPHVAGQVVAAEHPRGVRRRPDGARAPGGTSTRASSAPPLYFQRFTPP